MIAENRYFGFEQPSGYLPGHPNVFVSAKTRARLGEPTVNYNLLSTMLTTDFELDRLERLKLLFVSCRPIHEMMSGFHLPFSNTAIINTYSYEKPEPLISATRHQCSHLADSKNRPLYMAGHVAARMAVGTGASYLASKNIHVDNHVESSLAGFAARLAIAPIEPTERVAQRMTQSEHHPGYQSIISFNDVPYLVRSRDNT